MPVIERPDTARISWEANGPDDGQAVLLIMGLAYPAVMWFRLMPALTERYRVIRVDNRGAGHTGDVPGAPYTVETMAADCLAVLDAADVRTAHVVGISMGGLMAQEIALTAPERVRSLCLLATHPGIAHAVMNPRLDGENLAPRLGQSDWVEQLIPTGSRDLGGLVQLLTAYARKHDFEADGSDPGAFVDEMARRDHESRWPQWPRWLDRWLHGDGPDG